jgi:hypothetical protein
MNNERRKHERTPLCVRIRISHETFGSKIVRTRDISHGGLFLLVGDRDLLVPGTIIEGQVQDEHMERPVVKMEVLRVEPDGIALKFLD